MKWNDPDNIRYYCADSLIEKMGNKDQLAVIGFDNKAKVVQSFTTDKAVAKNAVRDTFTNGGTNICAAIRAGIDQFKEAGDVENKYMILLTDGSSSTSGIDNLLTDAKDNQIRIFTIGLGSGVNTTLLKKIASKTDGEYYFASVAEDLPDIFKDIQSEGITQVGGTGNGEWRPQSALAKVVNAAGFIYDSNGDIIKSKLRPHQKDYCYTYAYDNACTYMDMNIDCEPIYFFYDGKEYMVEFWKGQYGAETGGEIGVYYRETGTKKPAEWITGKWYKTNASDLWDMEFALMQKGISSYKKVMSRTDQHWWLTGFKWGNYVSDPAKLNMTAQIKFKNADIAQAFIKGYGSSDTDKKNYKKACSKTNKKNYDNSDDGIYGLKARGYQSGSGYTVNGKIVNIYFMRAKCKQPKLMVKRRKKVREHTAYSTLAYRVVRCICNRTSTEKAQPNNPNNFDISFCKHLNQTDVKKIVTAIYKEGNDVYNQFIAYVRKKDKALASKIDKSVRNNDWNNMTDKDFEKISKNICKYYDKAYKIMEDAPAKLVDQVMKTAGDVVKGVYE